jgi:hypothetical protein
VTTLPLRPRRRTANGGFGRPVEEYLRPGGLDPGGQESALNAEEGDAVGRLVDVDADVDRLAWLEADRLGGFPDDGQLPRLLFDMAGTSGVGRASDLRKCALRTTPRPSCYLSQDHFS